MDPIGSPQHQARPVTLGRIARAARLSGYPGFMTPEQLCFGHSMHCSSTVSDPAPDEAALAAEADSLADAAPGEPVPPRGRAYELQTTHLTPLPFSQLHAISEFVNRWNQECVAPQATLDIRDLEEIHVVGHTPISSEFGLTDAQLVARMDQALATAQAFSNDLVEAFPLLTEPAPVTPTAGAFEDLSGPGGAGTELDPANEAYALDVERVEACVATLGIDKIRRADERGFYAWINDVLCIFAVDEGNTLNVSGHWDPGLPRTDFLRLFLICNDLNADQEGSTAYCYSDAEGLQVRIDVYESLLGGITDYQLRHTLAHALKCLLHGVDHIAREATGTSPVRWPEV